MDNLTDFTKTPKDDEKKEICKGLVFRFTESGYLSSHGSIETRMSMRLLKTRSCPGCERCGWMMEELAIFLEDRDIHRWLGDCLDGKAYRLYPNCAAPSAPYYDDGECEFDFKEVQ